MQYMKTLQGAYKAMSKMIKNYQKCNLGLRIMAHDTFALWNTHGLPREAIEEELTRLGFTGDFSKF